ncbi:hypothetical protein ACP70R_011067 [Stipagrostis hirtigluma subsp. patula]
METWSVAATSASSRIAAELAMNAWRWLRVFDDLLKRASTVALLHSARCGEKYGRMSDPMKRPQSRVGGHSTKIA